ncbi:MAG: regulator of chromosome condensation 1/beta-lactamase-inhibitor protein II [Benjaminiella poitrasii]|nr:MAG: regulator of chromosome condensation 1/beta-lactamase-inhibitor protein II [Benjaminiella poitrasii]
MSSSISDSQKLKKQEGGTAYVVGHSDMFGEIGIYDIQDAIIPRVIPELEYESIIDIASSSIHTLAINRYGQIWSWGCGEFGALGRQGIESCPHPITHPSIRRIKFKKVACGNSISMAITTKGQLYTWGTFRSSRDIYGYLPNVCIQDHPRIPHSVAKLNFIDIAAGASHCIALDEHGHVYTWGCNEFSQLGRSTSTHIVDEMVEKQKSLTPTQVPLLNDIISVAAGAFHSLALDRYGQVYSWGLNHYQQCGLVKKKRVDDQDVYRTELDEIEFPRQIACFRNKKSIHNSINRGIEDHSIYAIPRGMDDFPTIRKITLSLIESIREKLETINIMDQHFHDQSNSEEVEEMDIVNNYEEKLPINDQTTTVQFIAAGDYHSIALLSDNTLAVWGYCEEGQLGLRFDPDYTYPGSFRSEETNKVNAIGCPVIHPWRCKEKIKKVVCGARHTIVLSEEGHAWGFGHSNYNQLGPFAEDNVVEPTLIDSLTCKVVNTSAGETHTVFIILEDIDMPYFN